MIDTSPSAQRTPQGEGLFPIRTAAAMTGVHPVTLRAWERRYGLVNPRRTAKGHRLYSPEDVHRIRRILELLDQGVSIGQVAPLLESPAPEPGETPATGVWPGYRRDLQAAAAAFDHHALERIYADALSLFPVQQVIPRLLAPVHRSLVEDGGGPQALAALQFFRAWARPTLGCRFRHEASHASGPAVALCPYPRQGDGLEADMLALLLATHGLRVLRLCGPGQLEAVGTLQARSGAGAVVLVGPAPLAEAVMRKTLPRWSAHLPVPVFAAGPAAKAHTPALERAGLIPLDPDPQRAAGTIHARLQDPAADDGYI